MKYFKLFTTLLSLVIICLLFTGCDDDIKTNYSWKCGDDGSNEGIVETKIIGIGTNEKADFELPPGKYEIKYTYINSDKPKETNRTYVLTVANSYVEDISTHTGFFYVFQPKELENKEIEVKEGQYIYIQHSANEKAKGGNIYITKK